MAPPRLQQKAGLSGLFLCLALVLSPAVAEPVAIEVVEAGVSYDLRTSEPMVSFRMSPASQRLFADLTTNNVGRKMAIRIDGRVMSSPVIREPILGGAGQISGAFTVDTARATAAALQAGRARLEFEIVD